MEMTKSKWIAATLLIIVAAFCLVSVPESAEKEGMNNSMDKNLVILLGASVGQEWGLQDYPERTKDAGHTFESIAVYQYDKSEGLEEILMRPKRKFRLTRTYLKGFFQPSPPLPGTIIVKECAAYFPGNISEYEDLIKQWVGRIREAKIEVLLATTVPITRKRAGTKKDQIEQILEFNDWMRSYAKDEHIRLLDLEAALRTDPRERYLRDELSTDGLHLNKNAYDILDVTLRDALKER